MKAPTLEGMAFCLVLGLGVCADGIASMRGGMVVLLGGVAFSGLLVHLAHSGSLEREQSQPFTQKKQARKGKRKAAAVVGTPQRQVKQTVKSISQAYFSEKKGDCQIWI